VRHRAHLLIPDVARERVLVCENGAALALPVVETSETWNNAAPDLNAAVWHQFGLRAVTLRCGRILRLRPGSLQTVFEMENLSPLWRPPAGMRWFSPADAQAAMIAGDRDRLTVKRWFSDVASGPPERRPPWQCPGWYEEASRWVAEKLRSLGITQTGPPEQIRQWSIACILRTPATHDAYLKAVPQYFAPEAAVIRAIAQRLPGAVPEVLAEDDVKRWTLMRAFHGTELRQAIDLRAAALRLLARVQQSFVGEQSVLATGAADRRLERLAQDFGELIARADVAAELQDDEVRRLRDFASEITERVRTLVVCGIPQTLVHGDFHPGNVSVCEDGSLMIFDWTDACLSHPFFDLLTFLPDDAAEREPLLHAYLEEWSSYGGIGELERAFEIAMPMACAHHAISYWRILDGTERVGRWEMGGAQAEWLRRTLAVLDGPPDRAHLSGEVG
jgi:aminoglycoside phosphotransferase (APT) family kinase protein